MRQQACLPERRPTTSTLTPLQARMRVAPYKNTSKTFIKNDKNYPYASEDGIMIAPTDILKFNNMERLPVVRDTYCSQKMTDDIIDYIIPNVGSYWLEKIVDNEGKVGDDFHYNAYSGVIEFVINDISKYLPIPSTDVGLVDLSYELRRRIRKALDLPEVPILGKPFAPSPEGPYPPELAKVKIFHEYESWGLTQEFADSVLDSLYQLRPDLFYTLGESLRRSDYLHTIRLEINKYIENIAHDQFGTDKKTREGNTKISTTSWEINRRVGVMCEIPKYSYAMEQR